jgi:hypothetical protein
MYAPYIAGVPKAIEESQRHERHNSAFRHVISTTLPAGRPLAALLAVPMNHVVDYTPKLKEFAAACRRPMLLDSLTGSITRAHDNVPRVGLPAVQHLLALFVFARRLTESYTRAQYVELPLQRVERAGTLTLLRSSGRKESVDLVLVDDHLVIYRHVRLIAQLSLSDCIIHTGPDENRWIIVTSMLPPMARYKFLPTPREDIALWNAAICMASLAVRTKPIEATLGRRDVERVPPPLPPRNPPAYLMLDCPWTERARGTLEALHAIKTKKKKNGTTPAKSRKDEMMVATQEIMQEASARIAHLEQQVAWLRYRSAFLANALDMATERALLVPLSSKPSSPSHPH